MAQIKPSIDDQFWFDWSKSHVEGAIERRHQAFAKLQNLVLWLWGIYTTYAAVGFALSSKSLELWPTLLIAFASGLLIAVYWLTVWGQMPLAVEYDPRSPDEINEAHSKVISTKDERLGYALALSVFAAIAVAAALVVAGTARPKGAPSLEASGKIVNNQVQIAVTAVTKPKTNITLEVFAKPAAGKEKRVLQNAYLSTKDGDLQVSVTVDKDKSYNVVVRWKDNKLERSMSRVVTLAKPTPKAKSNPTPAATE